MNDLDLRSALHRDADLVGPPSPDLLDQLVQRRRHQRHQRAGMLAAGLAVAVIAAAIPVGQSLMTRSDDDPASTTTVPTATPEVVATPTTTPAPSPAPAPAPTTVAAPTSAPPVADTAPPCPDLSTLDAALPVDTPTRTYSIFKAGDQVCSGPWVAAGYSVEELLDGQWWGNGGAGLWRYVDGSWIFHVRDEYCDVVTMPEVIYQRACMVD